MTQETDQQNEEIIRLLGEHHQGLSRGQISESLSFSISDKNLQRRLKALVDEGRLTKEGKKKATRYHHPEASIGGKAGEDEGSNTGKNDKQPQRSSASIFSPGSKEELKFLETPVHAREKVSYNREFLDSYDPNQSRYVPEKTREQLLEEGKRFDDRLAAGTYARQIYQRLLIDLSYNSSRLEGNTYSLLDTQKLVEDGEFAEGKVHEETVMIMNHKEAIRFLVENAQDIGLNSLTVRNVHNLLSQDLLANPKACGNIRALEVDIGQSSYKPLNHPQMLRELFELILQKAKKIEDPFEQSFFLLVHLTYLQAFEDVNKRTSRLCCNIPFIQNNLCPLSFTDVAQEDYTDAILAVYERNNTQPLLELFSWAYSRSCQQYDVAERSLGEIDAFRIKYRQQRKTVMGRIIKQKLHGSAAEKLIENYCQEHGIEAMEKFVTMTLADLSTLHAGAIIGLGITEAQLEEWQSNKPKVPGTE